MPPLIIIFIIAIVVTAFALFIEYLICTAKGSDTDYWFDELVDPETCEHPDHYIKVINSVANCETTVHACTECDTWLTSPKTECN